MERLQGSDWHDIKENVVISHYTVSHSGNICVCGTHTETSKKYYHWLNEEEKAEFKTEEHPETTWENFFTE